MQMPDTTILSKAEQQDVAQLLDFVRSHGPLLVLTGAGCSTHSGLGDYRDRHGQWKRQQPMTGQRFLGDETARKRYWARSALGWPVFQAAQPNAAHHGIRALQVNGLIQQLVTQNVDGLHQRAGSTNVIDLHGRLDSVSCTQCQHSLPRDQFQEQLLDANPLLTQLSATAAPDGDADLTDIDFDQLMIPACLSCGTGIVKPDVVFFGENVPREMVAAVTDQLARSRALLVVGSSLMVYSGFRFCRRAAEVGIPIAIVNQGVTRADTMAHYKWDLECGSAMHNLASNLATTPG